MLEAGLLLSRFLHFTATLSLFGVSLFPLYALGRAGAWGGNEQRLLRRIKWIPIVGALTAIASGVGWFVFTAASMTGDLSLALNRESLYAILQGTDFGPLWIVRLLLVCAALLTVPWWPRRTAIWTAAIGSSLSLALLAGTGHARATQGWAGSHMAADSLHLLAAGLWLGALLPLAIALRTFSSPKRKSDVLKAFSRIGQIAVGLLFATGIANSFFLLTSPLDLIATSYGKVLSVKLMLFALMLGLAALNRFWITPRVPERDSALWTRRLGISIAIEQALGLLLLLAVAVLGAMEPPGAG
ncbi:MAG: copper homeostasis membrane protein CopD [Alphaproteobacteria bacterium]|nr:copper homeostasis membrane protein CopD [Alphaproteobacteria bacterium]MBL7097371.1 copper homeostasis membrane protein CopD [Alphaproteobacteria bacterium]